MTEMPESLRQLINSEETTVFVADLKSDALDTDFSFDGSEEDSIDVLISAVTELSVSVETMTRTLVSLSSEVHTMRGSCDAVARQQQWMVNEIQGVFNNIQESGLMGRLLARMIPNGELE